MTESVKSVGASPPRLLCDELIVVEEVAVGPPMPMAISPYRANRTAGRLSSSRGSDMSVPPRRDRKG